MELVFEWEIDCGNEMGVSYHNCEAWESTVKLVIDWEINCETGN